ncbi:MAG TPA: hypothetical protein ENJ39_07160 [Flammeovirgaceae bacterium]|nr:hypothetical protein [Flammeovirgaceae bacterium]
MRKLFIILSLISSAILAFTLYDYQQYAAYRLDKAIVIGEQTVSEVKHHLDSIFTDAKLLADSLAQQVAKDNFKHQELSSLLWQQAQLHPYLMGITVAYEPYAADSSQARYSLFYNKKIDKFFKIEEQYDYRDTSLVTARWYTEVVKNKQPYLTEPYFARVARELVTDYSVPFFRVINGQKKLIGVVTLTLSLDQFTELVNSFVKGHSGYVYLIDQQGDYITHPNRSNILKHNVFEVIHDPAYTSKMRKALQTQRGHFRYISNYTGVPSILFYETTRYTNWKIAAVYSYIDLVGSPKQLERKIVNISMTGSLLFLFLLILFGRLYRPNPARLWRLSMIITLLFLLNIALFWLLQLDLDYSEQLENRTRVYSENALNSYTSKRDYEQSQLGKRRFLKIPTGIFIDELFVTDSYNMSLSGKIWQKWPVTHDLKDNTGFQFPQASPVGRSVHVELISKDKLDSATWLYTWKFNTTLRIFFDYNHYPLDQHYIDIKIVYPDITDNILLVPDFDSYKVLNPSSKPGLNDNIFLPRFRIIGSYFSFSSSDLKSYFGQNLEKVNPEYSTLEYNIVIKRRFVTPFISFVIPFIIGAAIIFFLLYSLNKHKGDNDISGVTVMGVVQGMAALFFSMLLAHITIRNKIPTPHITYLEAFYFVIYVMIILLILVVVMYARSERYKLLNYQNNLLAKVIYWPLLFGLLYLITLIKFY